MAYSLSLHLIALVMWVGGLMIGTLLMKNAAVAGEAGNPGVQSGFKKVFRGFIVPGMILATATGLYQFGLRGASFYMKQGWFHAKITLLLGLFVVTFLVGREIGRAASSGQVDGKKAMMLHGITGAILIAVVFITMVGRGV